MVDHMGVLVQPDGVSFPQWKISVPHAFLLRIAGDSVPVERILLARSEVHLQPERRIRLRRFPGGIQDREPAADGLPVSEVCGGDSDGSDQIGAKEVVVLDVKLEVDDGVSQRDVEPLVPVRVLGVLDDSRARHGRLRDGDGDVRVAGDDPGAVVDLPVRAAASAAAVVGVVGIGGGASSGALDGAADGDAAAEVGGDDVHVRQVTSFDDPEVQVAMEAD
ncbi:hypothetical protein TIFTF001_002205 [Ficus carica]|uniref:Uncharacterized protein n=1 Tax=Ficus carica TaxID=3494 RepID=A0AA88CSV9_FICCA|nr:hypothetical protein TIFTF001_002205 [Ficus carica]